MSTAAQRADVWYGCRLSSKQNLPVLTIVLDADNGRVLWETRLASEAVGGTVTFSINGRQYIAVAAGGGPIAAVAVGMTQEADIISGSNAMYVFALPQ